MMELLIESRPRTWIVWMSRFGLVIGLILVLKPFLESDRGNTDQGMVAMGAMLLVACYIGSFFKYVVFVDRRQRTITTKYQLAFEFVKKVYPFDELSTVVVKKQGASTQGADITRQANTSYGTMTYLVNINLKGFGKGRKSIRLKKCFDQQEADLLAKQVASLLN